ncbi:ATP-grasp domain-containing protein [Colwellia sp. 6M3]|jgi:predicted ATP-grasp superfamily ATP-dependent carboligase|uniref:ATP-grasp domain-containing protein n=1 Tax=Colwellia sp. 6M3 TaxID=2759849 RepID=UPI0015F6B02C|nr:ATP-grasp domain-containing protein [Colwellia sp. 6M3]MBA6415148.1 ATP-grasp domain-containing protein [Colwellia sp. 6M3]|tara:strand:- start:553 stop:1701 length:1149 start_codon:yes stop_codon:yes gene_type:complete
MANVLIVGKRGRCYRAALRMGHTVFLWSDGPLHESRKEKLAGWIETPFKSCEKQLLTTDIEAIEEFNIEFVIAATESSVDIAAMIRKQFKLTGTPLKTTNLLHNKNEMKLEALKHNIPITKFHLISDQDTPEILAAKLGLPLVVKPVAESGARGVMVLNNLDEIKLHAKPGLLAEAFVDGTEVSVETFIHNGVPIFHNITEYLHQWKKSIVPAAFEAELLENIININDRVIAGFGVKNGMTHAEFYLTKNGPVFGEMAVRPPGGYYMELIEYAYGFNPWKTYVELETAATPKPLPVKAKKFSCVFMIHPGAGIVDEVSGIALLKELKEVKQFKCKVEPGTLVGERDSTSSEVGHVLMSADTREALLEKLKIVENNLVIKMKQ